MTRVGRTVFTPEGTPFSVDEDDAANEEPAVLKPRIVPDNCGWRINWPRGDSLWRKTLPEAVAVAEEWWEKQTDGASDDGRSNEAVHSSR